MNLLVRKVNGMPFVKYPLGFQATIPHCNCRRIRGKFGTSLAIFLESSQQSVREKMQELEDRLLKIVRKVKPILEERLHTDYDEDDLAKVKLIKNDVVWAKCRDNYPAFSNDGLVVLRFTHIFFADGRISISVQAV